MSDFRKRVAGPFLIPIGAFVFIGALVFGFSRLLLVVTKDGSVILGVVLSAAILFGAGALSKSGVLKGSQRLALPAFAVLLTAGGVVAGVSMNTREVEGGPPPVGAEITAQGVKFDKAEIELPADERTGILFQNNDAGVLHNVSIYDTPQARQVLFQDPPFAGVNSKIYDLEEGLPKGVYFFRCDVHPPMQGRVLVGGATAPASPSPSPTATGPGPAPTSPSPSPTPTSAASAIALIAKDQKFDKDTLTFASGSPVNIDFDNQDPGQLHNFALYKDSTGSEKIFSGELLTGPAKTRYTFPAPAAGTYYFRCDAHPTTMFGNALVT